MSSSITVGSFYNVKSPLHALDPRVKMAIMVVFMVSVFLAPAPWGLIPVAVMLVLATVLSRVPLRIVGKAIKPLWFFVIFTALVNIFLVREGNVVAHFLGFSITDHALVQSVYMAFRVFALMMAGTIFSLVTSPISITDGACASCTFWFARPRACHDVHHRHSFHAHAFRRGPAHHGCAGFARRPL